MEPNLFSFTPTSNMLPKPKSKTGFLYKKGEGPIDYNWNHRYLVLDGKNLFYYKYASDKTPRGSIRLEDFILSTIKTIDVCLINNFYFYNN